MSTPRAAKGTLLKVSDGSATPTYVTVGRITNISGPNRQRAFQDATAMDSPGAYREFVATLREGGDVTFDFQFDPTDSGYLELEDNFTNEDATRMFKIIFPTAVAKEFQFSGWVTGLSNTQAVDDLLKASGTIKIDGAVTLADTA